MILKLEMTVILPWDAIAHTILISIQWPKLFVKFKVPSHTLTVLDQEATNVESTASHDDPSKLPS